MSHEKESEHHKKDNKINYILGGVIAFLVIILLFNTITISRLKSQASGGAVSGSSSASVSAGAGLLTEIIPKGTPNIYGSELGVKYDDISASNPQKADQTINKIGALDQQITLTGADLERYIKIASAISCEYCCGAASIIFSNGQPACGCAHSYAMRGLAKYLIKNHNNEFSDEEVLSELGKWKVLFFPEIHMQKASVLQQQGVELNYINLASNKYRGAEQGATGGSMVGGC